MGEPGTARSAAGGPGAGAAAVRRPSRRRTRRLGVLVGGREGPRSALWTVTVPRPGASGERRVVLTREGPDGAPARTVERAGRRLELPSPPAARGAPPPALGAALQSPAPGWHVGAVLVIPLRAVCVSPDTAVPDGTRRVPPPSPGHHVQIVLLLGDAGCAPLDLPPAQDAGSLLLPARDRIQLWNHHVPSGPRRPGPDPGTAAFPDVDGVPVVVDPGPGPASGGHAP